MGSPSLTKDIVALLVLSVLVIIKRFQNNAAFVPCFIGANV